MGFAAKAAADFRRGDTQLVGVKAQQGGALIAIHEWTLGTDPKFRRAIWPDVGQARVWFDVALVGLLGLIGARDHDIGFLQPCFNIAMAIFGLFDEVRRLGWLRFNAIGEDVIMQQWC